MFEDLLKKSSTIIQLYPYLWPKDWRIRWRMVIAGILLLASTGLNLGVPLVFRKAINAISLPSTPLVFVQLLLVSYGLLWALSKTVEQLRFVAMNGVIERGIRLLTINLFSHLTNLSLRFHTDRKTGAVLSIINRAQGAFPGLIWGLFFLIIPTILEIAIATIILTYLYGALYGAILISILILYMIFSFKSSAWAVEAQRIANEKSSQATNKIMDSLLNYETIRYFVNQGYEKDRCNHLLKEREITSVKHHSYIEWVAVGQGIIIGGGLLLLTWLSGMKVMAGTFHVSDFILINGYLLQFVMPLSYFGYVFRDINQGITNLEEVVALLKLQPEIQDAPNAKDLVVKSGSIIFKNVHFSYDLRRPILKCVSFEILPMKITAIVGATGSGKSTIANLIFRYYDVLEGNIYIDGQDLRSLTQLSLQSAIGIVPQMAALFNDTLRYNIAYGRPSASDAEIEKAIKDAHLDAFIATLPDGLNTVVGEHGLKLSGGERQRVAIARMLLKKTAIFIFDEATSSLDTKTENIIQKNIEEVSHNTTTLIIAHRLSTIIHADQILVLDNGILVERGTHQDLLAMGGLYAQLWEKQTRE